MFTELIHPFQIIIAGPSGSGKTTLISQLIKNLSPRINVGYLKHDAHKFSMDTPGKDTFLASQSGASCSIINDPLHWAAIYNSPLNTLQLEQSLLTLDAIIIEGYKNSPLPKLLFLKSDTETLSEQQQQDHSILGFIGPHNAPPKNINKPFFQRNDILSIQKFIEQHWQEKIDQTPLYGLILSGGKSSRMGEDKGSLVYHGQNQIEYLNTLLTPICKQVFVSARQEQGTCPLYKGEHILYDQIQNMGPIGGILSAQMRFPKTAWLVVACDLPFVGNDTLETLYSARNPFKVATCFKSSSSDNPEPLCTIYEPKAHAQILALLGFGFKCPRKILSNSPIAMIKQSNPHWLDNINTPQEKESFYAKPPQSK